jgi:hypothetical protein
VCEVWSFLLPTLMLWTWGRALSYLLFQTCISSHFFPAHPTAYNDLHALAQVRDHSKYEICIWFSAAVGWWVLPSNLHYGWLMAEA